MNEKKTKTQCGQKKFLLHINKYKSDSYQKKAMNEENQKDSIIIKSNPKCIQLMIGKMMPDSIIIIII